MSPRTNHKLTGTFQLCLYLELIGPLNISRCLRDCSLLYFTLITSGSGLPARDPLALCKSLWIWIFSTPWFPREKINISSTCQVDPDLRLDGFMCEKRQCCAVNSANPVEGPGPAGKRGVCLFSPDLSRCHLRSDHSSIRVGHSFMEKKKNTQKKTACHHYVLKLRSFCMLGP